MLVDVRSPAEFRAIHLPGSRNVPLGELGSRAEALCAELGGRRVALICRTGNRARSAAELLAKRGLERLDVLEGGVVAWSDAGLPVERGQKAFSMERQVRITAGSFVVLGVALGFFVHPGFLALAAFVGAGLAYSGLTDTCGMALVLAKMPWNR